MSFIQYTISLLSHPGIPGVTLCFCICSHAATAALAVPPLAADYCSRDNSSTTFWISFMFGTIVGPDLQTTWLDFGRFLSWPWHWIFKIKYGICYLSQKWSHCHETNSKHRLNSRPQMWPSGLTSAMILTLNFQGQIWNLLYLNQKWSDCH